MKKFYNTKVFIEKAKEIHGNRYDYSLVIYKEYYIGVNIICKRHGVFNQTPMTHLAGKNCPYCGLNRLTKKEFIEKANIIHNNFYDYSKCDYSHKKNQSDLITITCPKHGDFRQTIRSHLRGHKCYKCGREDMVKKKIKKRALKTPRPEVCDEYVITVRYTIENPTNQILISSKSFNNKSDAEKHLEEIEMFLEMTDCKILEKNISSICKVY